MRPDVGQEAPPWMELAIHELGIKEIPGAETNPEVAKYYAATSLGGRTPDSVPWCSAFANWVMQQAGYRGTRRANARSWLDWGIVLEEPRVGCIAVLWDVAPHGAHGHVGFFTASLPERVVLLGGNQGDRVCYRQYGVGRVLGYRWPRQLDLMTRSSS